MKETELESYVSRCSSVLIRRCDSQLFPIRLIRLRPSVEEGVHFTPHHCPIGVCARMCVCVRVCAFVVM